MIKPSAITPFTETISKAVARERLAEVGGKKDHLANLCCVDYFLELRQNGNRQSDRISIPSLTLRERKVSILYVLPTETYYVCPPLAGIQ
jgi:hypothetical protein